jgi:hypothetical protein
LWSFFTSWRLWQKLPMSRILITAVTFVMRGTTTRIATDSNPSYE